MKARWNEALLGDSEDTVVVEGNHYFPVDALDRAYFTASDHTSYCPWKGTAHYYHVVVDGERNENAAWYYPEPFDAAHQIQGRVAFWKGVNVSPD